ncbi:MAG: hypothetical protein AUG09_07315 [Acidobacteria bacterium 13_1_20CM_2_68_7]|nr:MAG: hypothetical protein AUG09_07315 [Acidobacteria bacterium 13_1_20CM_2_68_7]
MDDINACLEFLFRWIHVVAGIAWIGHLYFFNFVNSQVAKTYDADSKRKVIPELMPRALYWFRWGAAYTWVTGFLLAGMVYYQTPNLLPPDSTTSVGAGVGLSLLLIVAVFFIYDALWKAMAKNEQGGVIVSFILVAVLLWGLSRVFAPRAVYIHLGMLFGTIMAMNVWMRIWPAQKKIIAAVKAGTAPDGALAAMAGLRSKHNTYMSVPLVLSMVSNHYPTVYGSPHGWVFLLVLVAAGWGLTKLLYMKAARPAPAKY